MQFTVMINQVKAQEWGLNAQQAMLFAFVYEAPSWCTPKPTPNGTFFALSKAKILEELPLLTDKPDTVYRLLRQLADFGVIDLSHKDNITLVRITAKGAEWNRKHAQGSEKNPIQGRKKIRSTPEKNPSKAGKISDPGSEKNPTDHITSNQITNQITNHAAAAAGSDVFDQPPVRALPLGPFALPADWRPSDYAFQMLAHQGVTESFAEDAIPEFILYWRGRSDQQALAVQGKWDTRFVSQCLRQWKKFNIAVQENPAHRIPTNWRPSAETVRSLLGAGVPADVVTSLADSFRRYWTERGTAAHAWDSRFHDHALQRWQRARAEGDENLLERFTDRSWAEETIQ